MVVSDTEIRQRLRLGREFRQVEFKGSRPTSPGRDELADAMADFANAGGGKIPCGVTDGGRVRGMSPVQMAAVDDLLVEIGTGAMTPALRIDVHHREIDGMAFVLAEVSWSDTIHDRDGRARWRDQATPGRR